MSFAIASKRCKFTTHPRDVRNRVLYSSFVPRNLALRTTTTSSFTHSYCTTSPDSIDSRASSRTQSCTNTWTRPALLRVSRTNLKTSSSSHLSRFLSLYLLPQIPTKTSSGTFEIPRPVSFWPRYNFSFNQRYSYSYHRRYTPFFTCCPP